MNTQFYVERSTTAIRDLLNWTGRTICYVSGLLGIVAISQILLLICYDLSYNYRIFFHLTHIQSTIARFILAGTVTTLLLRFAIKLKRIIWWIWGTQTPDYQPNLKSQNPPSEDLIETARHKGTIYFWIGVALAYFFALTGFYQVAFAESIFVADLPKIPILSGILDYLAQFPLIRNLAGLTEILPAQNPVSYIIIGAVLAPLTLGLYNISYILKHNRFIRDNVRSNPLQTEIIYFAMMPLGILLFVFITWIFLIS